MDKQKKKTAAVTAVLFHIQAEEEALMSSLPVPEMEVEPPSSPDMWHFSTHQAQMMMRNLIQMRMVPGLKG
jgi:hypothetical protein